MRSKLSVDAPTANILAIGSFYGFYIRHICTSVIDLVSNA